MLCAASWILVESGSSWITGAPGAMACSMSSTAGSTSYSTSIRRSARSAMARRLGRHGRHAVAHEAHLGIEQVGVVRRRLRPRLAGGGVRHARHVLISEDRVHPGQRLGLARVDAPDARVGVRAGQDLADRACPEGGYRR